MWWTDRLNKLPSSYFRCLEEFWVQTVCIIISLKLWWECHLAGHKHSVFGMTFVFITVAAVYIAFREMAEKRWVFARAACHRVGDEATEKCWLNDAHCSCFACLKLFHDLYLYYNLNHSTTWERKKRNCKHSPVNRRVVFVPKGASLLSPQEGLYFIQDELQTFFQSEKVSWCLASLLFKYRFQINEIPAYL